MKKTVQEYAKNHRMIFWDIPKDAIPKMNDSGIFERFLSYGQWDDIQNINKILPKKKRQELFREIAYKPRTNLRPETISYFADYYGVK